MTELLGDGIFNVDGAMWYRHRKIASHLFKRRELDGFMTKCVVCTCMCARACTRRVDVLCRVFQEHGRKLQEILAGYAKSGEEFDMQVRQ